MLKRFAFTGAGICILIILCCIRANGRPYGEGTPIEMKRMKPLIGINTNFSKPEMESALLSVRVNYADAVSIAGGVPMLLPPLTEDADIERQVNTCDGFILVGGADISPERYNAVRHPASTVLPHRREEYDFKLISKIMEKRKPFLAICLGCQEINVAMGGTIVQDIADQTSTTIQHSKKQAPNLVRHDVDVCTGTILYDLLATTTINTNSAHHQAIDSLGKGMRVSAKCIDGTTECVELTDYPFGLGIQWHPEYLVEEEVHRKLFQALVKASTKPSTGNQKQSMPRSRKAIRQGNLAVKTHR
jgi:putative glutamine amidotransferase